LGFVVGVVEVVDAAGGVRTTATPFWLFTAIVMLVVQRY